MRTHEAVIEPLGQGHLNTSGTDAPFSLGFLKLLAGTIVEGGPSGSQTRLQEGLGEVLFSEGPKPELADKLALFGRLVGSWDLEVTSYPEHGEPLRHSGEWHFGWALEGRAIVDVWISPAREDREGLEHPGGDYGMSVRFYDPSLGAWRSTWIGPMKGMVRSFIARPEGERGIVLEGCFTPGVETRWVFSDISAESFRWQSLQSSDGWKTQRLWQEMRALRA